MPYLDEDTVKLHLYKNGFRPNYYQWSYHGEVHGVLRDESAIPTSNRSDSNQMRDMVIDALGPITSN